MGLIERILRVFRANVNSWISGAEDPEKILEQTFLEMQENLVQLRQGVAQAIASQKRTERQANQAESTANEWYRRTQLALEQGNESLAREALTRRKAYQNTAQELFTHIEEQKAVVTKLKQEMRKLELKISEMKTKKDMYIARARSAEANSKLQELIGGVDPSGTQTAFERMEEKVLQLEAQTEAIAISRTDNLQEKFDALDNGGDIDAELAEMKKQISSSGNNSTQSQLPDS
ncbi:MAG: PspA/IM30 family protein [Cyanobacteria bacterium P01_A01_bin.45]